MHFMNSIYLLAFSICCFLTAKNPLTAQSKPQKIIILYSPVGAGHISAARTIKKDLLIKRPKTIVVLKDVTDFGDELLGSKKLANTLDQSLYMTIFNHFPNVYTSLYNNKMQENLLNQRMEDSDISIKEEEFYQYLKEEAQNHSLNHVLSTHYMGARALGALKSKGQMQSAPLKNTRISWVNTDYFIGYFPRISQYLDKNFSSPF